MTELSVAHQPSSKAAGKFVLNDGGTRVGYLDYSLTDGTVCIDYVQVSPAFRGKRMGNRLVDAAVEWARAGKRQVTARCSFARTVLDSSRKYDDVLAD
jgi:uncharacterized protein